jgi:uncharacterized protein YkwD
MTSEPNAKSAVRLSGLGDWSARECSLGAPLTSVGSDRDNDLRIEHPTVSRRHAILRHDGGRFTLEDLESTNGTAVNGQRIKGRVAIEPGDEISFGAARFALLGGGADARVKPRPRKLSRMPLAITGILLCAIAGFMVTRYALTPSPKEHPAAEPSMAEVARLSPAPAREVTQTAEPSVAAPTPAPSDVTDATFLAPLWLKQVNDFRASVNLAPVESDPKLSDGDRKHATYLLKNFATEIHEGTLGVEVHSEDAANALYTPEGAEAARNSDIAEQGAAAGQKLPDPQGWAIDGWMVAPLHRLPILSPLLHQAGFAFDCENTMCVALLNVHSGADAPPRIGAALEHPILFPPDDGSIPSAMAKLENEIPNPLTGCNGYTFPAGLPITVQLGPAVEAQLNSFSIARADGDQIEACGFDANSYYNPDEGQRNSVIGMLRSHGAIVIIPRNPLEAGTRYEVLAMVNGRDYKWSFTISR